MLFTGTNQHVPNASPRTLCQIHAPQDEQVKILGADITLQGSQPASTPILLQWVTQATAGNATSLTPQKNDRGSTEAVKSKLFKEFTAEPTTGVVLWQGYLHQQGSWPWVPRFKVLVNGGERVGLVWNSGTFVPVSFTIYFEE